MHNTKTRIDAKEQDRSGSMTSLRSTNELIKSTKQTSNTNNQHQLFATEYTRQRSSLRLLLNSPTMKILSTAFLLLLSSNASVASADPRDRHLQGNGNGNGNQGDDSTPEFLADDELPQGLVNNPSQSVGVDFKPGKKPKGQKLPDMSKKKATIRSLDGKPIKLDLETAERINVYHPDRYTVSADGSSVTENETGEVFKLNVFYASDHKNELDITYSLDENGSLANVQASPKSSEDEPENEDEVANVKAQGKKAKGLTQNFQRLNEESDVLVGYFDDDVDLTNAPLLGDPPNEMEEGDEVGNRLLRRRAQSSSWSATRFGKTCSTFDWLDVRIVTDSKFKSRYWDHKSKSQAIFAEAAKIYWDESCVWLYMWSYESSVGSNNWITPNGQHMDTRFAGSVVESGCGGYGALQILRDTVKAKQRTAYRDAWHLFSGASFSGNTIGCAYINVCKNDDLGFGANEFTFTTNLRMQGVLFAHEVSILSLCFDYSSTTNEKNI